LKIYAKYLFRNSHKNCFSCYEVCLDLIKMTLFKKVYSSYSDISKKIQIKSILKTLTCLIEVRSISKKVHRQVLFVIWHRWHDWNENTRICFSYKFIKIIIVCLIVSLATSWNFCVSLFLRTFSLINPKSAKLYFKIFK